MTRPPSQSSVVIVEDKAKNRRENITAPLVVISLNLIVCFVILPLLVIAYEQREDLSRYILVGALAIPALLGILYLLYRAYWWGMGCLTTALTLLLVSAFAFMTLNELPFRVFVNMLTGF